jgi:hemerythrin-like metal-binding protein
MSGTSGLSEEEHSVPGIEWDDKFLVGIPLIDEQHKMLIQRVNDLAQAIERHQSVGEIVRVLGFLIDYTNFHFATEEKHMIETDYPGLNDHKRQHEEFKTTLNHLTNDFEEEGATKALADSINTFLTNWLVTHFQEVDREFGTFLLDKGRLLR